MVRGPEGSKTTDLDTAERAQSGYQGHCLACYPSALPGLGPQELHASSAFREWGQDDKKQVKGPALPQGSEIQRGLVLMLRLMVEPSSKRTQVPLGQRSSATLALFYVS